MAVRAQDAITGASAQEIAASVRELVDSGALAEGDQLPPVRALAERLGVNRNTVVAAYKQLTRAGVVVTAGRAGTSIAHRPAGPLEGFARAARIRDIGSGNPARHLLPAIPPVGGPAVMYGEPATDPGLGAWARASFAPEVPAAFEVSVAHGATDAIERLLALALGPGDAVALEDPGFLAVATVAREAGYRLVPVPVDGRGMTPDGLAAAIAAGARAVVVTPRAQNPTGASLDGERAAELRATLAGHPHVLVIEDDHHWLGAADPYRGVLGGERWALVRSLAKGLGPDLRVALVASDPGTAERLAARLNTGTTWVSHLLQRAAHALLADAGVRDAVAAAGERYRVAALDLARLLLDPGLVVEAGDGPNVWLSTPFPAAEVAQRLRRRGWIARTGPEFAHAPGVAAAHLRLTVHDLPPAELATLAEDLTLTVRTLTKERRRLMNSSTPAPQRQLVSASRLDGVLYDIRGPVADRAAELSRAGVDVLALNSGNPAPFGFEVPPAVLEAMRSSMDHAHGYSDSLGIPAVRETILDYYRARPSFPEIPLENVVIGNGVSELVTLCLTALLETGDEVLVPSPDYPLWTASTVLAGGHAVHYPCDETNGWQPDLEAMAAAVTDRTRAIVLINPNNPTGAVYSREIVEGIAEIARRHGLLIFSDEIYDRVVFPGFEHLNTAAVAPDVPVITFSGLSKTHRVAGYRAGWIVATGFEPGNDYLAGIRLLASMRMCASVPGQLAIGAALPNDHTIGEMMVPGGRLYDQREATLAALREIPGVTVHEPGGGLYVFPRVDPELYRYDDDERLVLDLLEAEKILLVHGRAFNWARPDHLRIAFLPALPQLQDAMSRFSSFLAARTR